MTPMTFVARTAGLAACLMPLAALAQFSSPMRDVENPDRFPYQETVTVTLDPPYVNNFALLPTPAGKRYVIEFVDVACTTPSSGDTFPQIYLGLTKQLSPTSSRGISMMLAPMVRQGAAPFGGVVWSSQTALKAYSDPSPFSPDGGQGITLNMFHTDTSVRPTCSVVVTGHTITP